jgi:SAM-dependent methyltransferase
MAKGADAATLDVDPSDGVAFPPPTAARRRAARAVARVLRGGEIVDDAAFDAVFPEAVRRVSEIQWTPVEVAFRAARFLAPARSARVLDLGAGAGKFCLVAAAATGAEVHGIEQSAYLVDVAREAARRMRLDVAVRQGPFESEDPSTYDGLYLFNPFTDSLVIPGAVPPTEEDTWLPRSDVLRAERFLRGTRIGARVATFCGFGGAMPRGFQCVARERRGGGLLELWTKADAP